MEAIMRGWLSVWLYVMTAIGIVLGVLVYRPSNSHPPNPVFSIK